MKVLVTGGAGFLGRHLVRKLVDEGQQVRIVDLEPLQDDRFDDDPVEFVEGHIADHELMDQVCEDVDVLVHAAAALPIQSRSEIQRTDFEGTQVTLQAADQNSVDRFVFISTTAVYGIHDTPFPVPEGFPKDPVGPYGLAKYRAEQECLKYEDKMFMSILRPKTFVGPERLGIMGVLFDWIRRGKNIYLLGDGTNEYQLLDVEDLCDAIWLACTHARADSIFNVGATDYSTINEDMQPVLERADTGSRLVHLPARPVQWILRFLEALKLSPIVEWQYGTVDKNLSVDTSSIENRLGWTPEYSNQESIMRNFEWYMDNYEKIEGRSGKTHRTTWNQKILKIIRLFS